MGGTATEMMLERPQEAVSLMEPRGHRGFPLDLDAMGGVVCRSQSTALLSPQPTLFRSLLGSAVHCRLQGAVCGIVTEGEVSNVAQAEPCLCWALKGMQGCN